MKNVGAPDSLYIINGPEDGTEFAIGRAPVTFGSDGSCMVALRLDRTVIAEHAVGTLVPDGYRIRCTTTAPAYVNDKRVGKIFSQILRAGDVLKLGHTELILECAPDGLASRSRGISLENDFVWLIRHSVTGLLTTTQNILRWLLRVPRWLFRGWRIPALVVAVVLFYTYPPFNRFIWSIINLLQDIYYLITDRIFG